MWNSSRLSFLECYRVWVWCVWSFSSVIFGREVIYPLLNQKANSCRDSLERPGSHSKRRTGCFPHLGSEAFSLSGKSCVFPGSLLAPSSDLLRSCSLASSVLISTCSSWLAHPRWEQQSRGAPQTCSQAVCVAGETVSLHVWAAPLNGGLFVLPWM